MNFGIIKRTLGWLLLFEAVFFLVPLITAIIYSEKVVFDFLIAMGIAVVVGCLLLIGKPKKKEIYAKEGFVIVALSWIFLSLVGAVPLFLSKTYPTYIDALFEIVSGFTTTGASVLTGEQISALPKCILIWRSFTHWIGGMGVLVFIMAFLPLCAGGSSLNIMRAESPGPTVSKLVPKIRTTTAILYLIYAGLTVLQLIMLLFGGISFFDAINLSFATAGTGGFAVSADGLGGYSPYIQIVVTIFMLLFSVSFTSYYFILRGKFKDALNTEFRVFFTIVVIAIAIISVELCVSDVYQYTTGEAIRHSAFSVASIISTTGFSTVDFNLWPSLSKSVLVIMMFIGACAGSTGGGIKVSRMIILFKGASNETRRMLHPKQVKKIMMDKRPVDDEVVKNVFAYIFAFILIFVASLLIISLDGFSLTTNFTAISATINNIGPGLDVVGPAGSYGLFSWWSKLVMIFDMLAGRLELFPILALLLPQTWKK